MQQYNVMINTTAQSFVAHVILIQCNNSSKHEEKAACKKFIKADGGHLGLLGCVCHLLICVFSKNEMKVCQFEFHLIFHLSTNYILTDNMKVLNGVSFRDRPIWIFLG